MQKFAVILEGIEFISNLMVRYDIYTTLYLRDTDIAADEAKATSEMRRCMVELHISVLSFLAKARRYYTGSKASECHFYWTSEP